MAAAKFLFRLNRFMPDYKEPVGRVTKLSDERKVL